MKALGLQSFIYAVDYCIVEAVDFVLISGDIFNTAMPGLDLLKDVTIKLRQLKDKGIPVYIIAGSHDFSVSGKTMLDVLEEAGLWMNVLKGSVDEGKRLKLDFTIDLKTGAKITGMLGKAGTLEKSYYGLLARDHLESEDGFKIFMFHSAINEYMPQDLAMMDSMPLSFLPKRFNYYAAGHVHYVFQKQEPGYGLIAFPGPLFPCNFREMENLGHGSFNIIEKVEQGLKLTRIPVELHESSLLSFDCDRKNPEQVNLLLSGSIPLDCRDRIFLLKFNGRLSSGRISDIRIKEFADSLYAGGAYFVMRSTSALSSPQFEEIRTKASSVEQIEDDVLREHSGSFPMDLSGPETDFSRRMLSILSAERLDGEKASDFEERIDKETRGFLNSLGLLR